jgi:hypothetical protein
VESTVAAGGTTALALGNSAIQVFTSNGGHTLRLPTTDVTAGMRWTIINQQSSGSVNLQSSTAASITAVPAQHAADCTALVNTPTTAAHWRVSLWAQTAGVIPTTSNSLAAFQASTSNTIGVGNIELGHASDCTLSRSAAGTLAVEGVPVVTTTGVQTISNKVINESTVAVGTVGATVTLGLTGTIQTATLTSNTPCTVTMPAAASGASFVLYLRQPATGTPTTAAFTNVRWGTGGAPVITAVLGRMDILTFFSDGTNWYGQAAQGFQY